MKNLKMLLVLVLICTGLQAQTETEAKSKIEAVTVFLNGAQIQRSSDVNLKKGRNILYFRGLGEGINPQSIQASAPAAFLINSVVHQVNYLDVAKESAKVQGMRDSLEIIKRLFEDHNFEFGVLESEKGILLRNQAIASKEQGLSVDELEKAVAFFRQRLGDILEKQMLINRGNVKLAARQNVLNRQISELNAVQNRPSNDIKVIIEADNAGMASIELRYFSNNARWIPSYNIRSKDSKSPMSLEYKADIYQNTGENWDNVLLTLNTGNPNLGGTQPDLSPWNLYVQAPQYYRKSASKTTPASGAVMYESQDEKEEVATDAESGHITANEKMTLASPVVMDYVDISGGYGLSDYTTVQEGSTAAEFVISVKQSIASDGKSQQVSVKTTELPADYRHYAVPKLDNDAFLVSGVTGWDTLNLLPGKAQIFFEGTYVTEVDIDPAYTRDTLNLSLGRDKKVIIERNQLKDFNKVRFLGTNRERTFAYEIKVRNTKSVSANLRLEDQIPVTQDKDIEVKLLESSSGNLDPATGKLTWDLQLAPSETKVIQLKFSVKYPKAKYIPGI